MTRIARLGGLLALVFSHIAFGAINLTPTLVQNLDGTRNTKYPLGDKPTGGGDTCVSGWTCGHLGNGSSSFDDQSADSTLITTVAPAGDDDGIGAVYKTFASESNRHIEARIDTIVGNAGSFSGGGIFMAEGTTFGTDYKTYCWWPQVGRVRFKSDVGGAGESSASGLTGQAIPRYVGSEYEAATNEQTCWESSDGATWVQVGIAVVNDFQAGIYGVFATSDDGTSSATTTISEIVQNTTLSFSEDPPAATIFEEDFESATWYQNNGWGSATSGQMSNTLSPQSGNNYLTRVCLNENGIILIDGCAVRIRFNDDTNTGTNMAVHIVDEIGHVTPLGGTLWYRYWMVFGANFTPTNEPGYLTKLPGFSAATDGRTDECGSGGNLCVGTGATCPTGSDCCTTGAGTCGWSARQQAMSQNTNCQVTDLVPMGMYAYYGNTPPPHGSNPESHTKAYTGLGINTGCTQGIPKTEWFCVKGRLKLNTPAGTANGEHEIFINDVSVYSATGVLFAGNSSSLNSIYLWWGNQFTGGGGAGNGGVPRGFMLVDSDDYIDNLVISETEPSC